MNKLYYKPSLLSCCRQLTGVFKAGLCRYTHQGFQLSSENDSASVARRCAACCVSHLGKLVTATKFSMNWVFFSYLGHNKKSMLACDNRLFLSQPWPLLQLLVNTKLFAFFSNFITSSLHVTKMHKISANQNGLYFYIVQSQ